MGKMNKYQQAAQVWAVLVLAARNRQLLTYSTLEQATGIQKRHQGPILGLIVAYCKARHWPKLTSIVVAKTGLPADKTDKPTVVPKKQIQVFEFNWLKRKAPSPQKFGDSK
jgi:hypothetical protein